MTDGLSAAELVSTTDQYIILPIRKDPSCARFIFPINELSTILVGLHFHIAGQYMRVHVWRYSLRPAKQDMRDDEYELSHRHQAKKQHQGTVETLHG